MQSRGLAVRRMTQALLVALTWLTGPAAWAVGDHCLWFNGTSEYATIDDACDALNNATALTVECWIRPDVVNNDSYFVAFNDSDRTNNIQLGIDGAGALKIMRDDGVASGSTLNSAEWFHVAVTVAADDTTIVYLNGVSDITTTTTERPATDGFFSLAQEWDGGGPSNYFDGQVDEVRIWDDVRTPAEIRANMHRPLQGNEANLVAYYKLDEGTGFTLTDETASGADGGLNSGTWVNSGAIAGPGNALVFDGNQQYVEVANGSALIANQAAFSMECWVYPRTANIVDWTTDFEGFVGIRNETNDFYLTRTGNTSVHCRLRTGGPEYDVDASVQVGEWQHYALVYTGSSLIVYRNGLKEDEFTNATGQITNGAIPLRIGKQFYSSYHWPLDGLVDEVRIWTDARTVDEIRENMCRTLRGDEANLAAYYRFDQSADAGQGTLYDQTGGGADGTLNNMDPATDWVASTAFNTWLGAADASWTTADNWARGVVPGATDNICVPDYTAYPSNTQQLAVSSNPTVNHCVVNSGGGITFGTNLTVSGNLILNVDADLSSHSLVVGGALVNNGEISFTSGVLDVEGPFYGGAGSLTLGGVSHSVVYLGDAFDLGTFTAGCSTVQLDGSSAQTITTDLVFDNLTIDNAAGVDASGVTSTVNGMMNVADGSLTAKGDLHCVRINAGHGLALSGDITVSGDWTNNGTFTHNNHAVELDGTNQRIYGDTTFHTLIKTVAAADTLTFMSGNTTTVTENLTLKGTADESLSIVGYANLLALDDGIGGGGGGGPAEWSLDPPDAGTIDMQYLDILGCNNLNADPIDLSSANCVDSGMNTNLIFANPAVTTEAVSNITATTATGNGTITSAGSPAGTQHGVCWSTSADPTIADDKTEEGVPAGAGAFTSSITGLAPTTTYHVRAYITDAFGTTRYGSDVSFVSGDVVPTVSTTTLSDISETAATAGGNVTDDGGASITARGVCWNTAGTPTIADNKTTDGTGTGTFSSSLTGLSPDTTYYVRAYATNSAGTSYGSEKSFTTDAVAPVAPTVTTASISDIVETAATAGGDVTDDGGASITARGVCWNTAGAPTTADNKTTDGTGTGTFASSLTGLSPDTTYYVRAYATNSVGTAYGDAVSFTTDAADDDPSDDTPSAEDPPSDEDEDDDSVAPNLQVSIAASKQAAAVGEELTFEVDVQNVGTGDATEVVLRFPLPLNAEFIGAWLVENLAAQAVPLNAYVEDDEIVVEIGDVRVAEDLKLELALAPKTSGKVMLEASISSAEQAKPATAQANTDVEVEDVYYEVVQPVLPLNACGAFGVFSPLLLVFGLSALRRRR